jgi:hypothetical protein
LRYLHLGAIAFVAAEAVLGVACPLTVWEDLLRGGRGKHGGAESFVARWLRALLFYQAPEWVFNRRLPRLGNGDAGHAKACSASRQAQDVLAFPPTGNRARRRRRGPR